MKRVAIYIVAIILSLAISLPAIGGSSSISYLKLKGTLFTRGLNPLAIIEDTRNGGIAMYELGDTIEGGFKIINIARGQVRFKAQEGEFSLSFPTGAVWQARTSSSNEDENWYKIRREGDIFVTDEATVSNALARVLEIMRNVRINPHFMNGKKSGVKVSRLNQVGILKEIGIRKGDVIKTINGLKLNTPYQIFTAYRKLRNQQELRVDIIRDSQPLLLTYKIERGRKIERDRFTPS